MKGLKRQVSPGAAAFLVIIVLGIVQYVWWRGLVYKAQGPAPRPGGGAAPPPAADVLTLFGRDYVTVDTFAGDLEPGDADGPGYNARFDRPTGLTMDGAGTLYVADTGNHRIRTVRPDGTVSTFAGSVQGFADGPAGQARFNAPCGVCFAPDGSLYVADTGNGCVRRIHDGVVTTIVQRSQSAAGISMPAAIAYIPGVVPRLLVSDAASKFQKLFDMNGKLLGAFESTSSAVVTGEDVVAAAGKGSAIHGPIPISGAESVQDALKRPALRHISGWCSLGTMASLVTDTGHGAVFLEKNGRAEVLAGVANSALPVRDWRDGNGENAYFSDLTGIATDDKRFAYVADTSNNCIRRLTLPDFLFH